MELFVRSSYEFGLKLNLLLPSKNIFVFKSKMLQGLRLRRRSAENDGNAFRLIRCLLEVNFDFFFFQIFVNNDP